MKKMVISFAVVFVLLGGFLLWRSYEKPAESLLESSQPDNSSAGEVFQEVSIPEPEPEPEPSEVRFLAAGDNLIHSSLYQQALARGGDHYDFTYTYENVESLFAQGDLCSINQETVISPIYEPSSYPCFNSPVELAQRMLDLGFTVFNQANNHTLDKGEKGLIAALENWKNYPDAIVTGAYLDESDFEIRTKEVNGITFAFLGATELTNGLSLPQGSQVILVQTKDEELIRQRLAKARELADVVVCNVHWGVEYTHTPTDFQYEFSQKLADWGADIIIGHHPHVIQPMEWLTAEDGRQVLCAYSLGNFVSAQDTTARMLGGVLDMTIVKETPDSKAVVTGVVFQPVVTHYDAGFSNVRVYPFMDYTEELAASHGVRRYTSFGIDILKGILNDVIDEEFLPDFVKATEEPAA